jgi:type I restriction-modification system DNA methylase subunit
MTHEGRIVVADSTPVQDSSRAPGASAPSGSQTPYVTVASAAHRKQFGQFFTPPKVAALMADWVTSRGAASILDPALGTGILISACMKFKPSSSYTAFEKDPLVISYIPEEVKSTVRLYRSDFLTYEFTQKFDGITMNPPYIRHREIEGHDKVRGRISLDARCIIPKSANLYIYFAVKALGLLREGGRAALLIPGEWMSANFAATFKEFVVQSGFLKEIVLFSSCSNVFDDALTTASILLCEK